MYYPLMFDIELFTFQRSILQAQKKHHRRSSKHTKNGGKGQETQLEHKAATRMDRRAYLGRLQHYSWQ